MRNMNKLPTLDEQVKAAWSEVLNQYQRRSDLIPNLVETVKGYAHQEQTVLTQVVEARAKATQMQLPADVLSNPQAFHEFEQNQAQISGALGDCSLWRRRIPISSRIRISSRFNRSSRAPRIGSRWRVATTFSPCRTTSRRSGPIRNDG